MSLEYSQEEGPGHWGLKVPLIAYVLEISAVDLPVRRMLKAEEVKSDYVCSYGSPPSGVVRSKTTRVTLCYTPA